jgi:hypothetical protein
MAFCSAARFLLINTQVNGYGGVNDSTFGGKVSATEIIGAALSAGHGRFATSSATSSLHSEPSTANRIFIVLPPAEPVSIALQLEGQLIPGVGRKRMLPNKYDLDCSSATRNLQATNRTPFVARNFPRDRALFFAISLFGYWKIDFIR